MCLKNKETQAALRSLPKTITSCRSHQACDFPALKAKGAFLQEREGSWAGLRIHPLRGEVVAKRDPCYGDGIAAGQAAAFGEGKHLYGDLLLDFMTSSFSQSHEIMDVCFQRESLNRSRAGAPARFSVLRGGMQGYLSWHHTEYSTRLL